MKAKNIPKILDGKREILQDVLPITTPFLVTLCVTNLCNLSCKFCYHNDPATKNLFESKAKFIEWEPFVKIINDLKQFPKKLKVFRLSASGEPFLHPDYVKMLEYVHEMDIADRLEVFTNGLLLTKELSDGLINAGLNKIIFSIEALSDEGYFELCGRRIDFENLVRNIKYLYDNKGDKLKIHVKMADMGLKNKAEEERFYDIFGDICDEIFIEHIIPISLESVKSEIIKLTPEESRDKDILGNKIIDRKVCPFIFTTMIIGSNLKCQLCNRDTFCSMPAGDANVENLYNIWNGPTFNNLRKAHLKNGRKSVPYCRDCTNIIYTPNDNIDEYAQQILDRFES